MKKTEQQTLCVVGRSSERPCPYPATESLPYRFPGDGPHLCAFHAATEPLIEESNELSVSLNLVQGYLKGARRHPAAAPLVKALERIEADLSEREELVDKVLEDLRASERELMRGERAK